MKASVWEEASSHARNSWQASEKEAKPFSWRVLRMRSCSSTSSRNWTTLASREPLESSKSWNFRSMLPHCHSSCTICTYSEKCPSLGTNSAVRMISPDSSGSSWVSSTPSMGFPAQYKSRAFPKIFPRSASWNISTPRASAARLAHSRSSIMPPSTDISASQLMAPSPPSCLNRD